MSSITTTTRIWETLRGSITRNRSNNYLRDIKTNRIITISELILHLNKTKIISIQITLPAVIISL